MAQEDMVRLQQLLKEEKKKMTASSEQGKSKKKLAARVGIQNIQKLICALLLGIIIPPFKNDPQHYERNWPPIVKIAEVKIEQHQQRCQEIERYKMDDIKLSNDDNSIGCVSHILTDTGVNNSDAESVPTDKNNNDNDDDEEDQGSYHTKDGMDQEELSTSDNMETNGDENEENGSEGIRKMQIVTTGQSSPLKESY